MCIRDSCVLWGGSLDQALPSAPDFVASQPDVKFIHRRAGDAEIYFVSNQQKAERTVDCTLRVAGRIPALCHPASGRMETMALYRTANGCTTLPIRFDPVGSVFVIFRRAEAGADPVAGIRHDGKPLPAGDDEVADLPTLSAAGISLTAWAVGDYEISLLSGKTLSAKAGGLPSPLTLDGGWHLSFPSNLGAPATATFDHLMSWTESSEEGVEYFSGTATYEKEVAIPAEYIGAGRRL